MRGSAATSLLGWRLGGLFLHGCLHALSQLSLVLQRGSVSGKSPVVVAHMDLPTLTVPIELVSTVGTSKNNPKMLAPHMGIQPGGALGPKSGRLTFFM